MVWKDYQDSWIQQITFSINRAQNWNTTASVSMGTKYESGFIIQASLETQFSLSSSYGGVNINLSKKIGVRHSQLKRVYQLPLKWEQQYTSGSSDLAWRELLMCCSAEICRWQTLQTLQQIYHYHKAAISSSTQLIHTLNRFRYAFLYLNCF